jgi:hypothetical protein
MGCGEPTHEPPERAAATGHPVTGFLGCKLSAQVSDVRSRATHLRSELTSSPRPRWRHGPRSAMRDIRIHRPAQLRPVGLPGSFIALTGPHERRDHRQGRQALTRRRRLQRASALMRGLRHLLIRQPRGSGWTSSPRPRKVAHALSAEATSSSSRTQRGRGSASAAGESQEGERRRMRHS